MSLQLSNANITIWQIKFYVYNVYTIYAIIFILVDLLKAAGPFATIFNTLDSAILTILFE